MLHFVDCSVCKDDYAKGPGFTCTKCTENVWGIIVATIFLALSAIITFAAVKYLLSVEIGARQGILARILRRVPLQSVKIIIVAWQILTQVRHYISSYYTVKTPGIVQGVSRSPLLRIGVKLVPIQIYSKTISMWSDNKRFCQMSTLGRTPINR